MKTLPSDLTTHLSGCVTTLATCWRLTRRDGAVMGFTDHDRDLIVAGIAYQATTGLAASESIAAADLSVGGGEVAGALSSAAITEDDIAAGLYDGATIDVYLVNWSTSTQALHLRTGILGEVVRRDGAFSAEVRSLAHALDEPKGRIFQHRCDADLGDARCGVNLTDVAWRGVGTVVSVFDSARFIASGLGGFAAGWFQRGRLSFTTGANAGRAMEVKTQAADPSGTALEMWQAFAAPVAAGDQFVITAGCDKLIDTCAVRFANAVNFRGFPHLPGSDYLIAHPALANQPNDGSALVQG